MEELKQKNTREESMQQVKSDFIRKQAKSDFTRRQAQSDFTRKDAKPGSRAGYPRARVCWVLCETQRLETHTREIHTGIHTRQSDTERCVKPANKEAEPGEVN